MIIARKKHILKPIPTVIWAVGLAILKKRMG